MKALFVSKTRPEAITMAAIIEVMAPRPEFLDLRICVAAQADATTRTASAMAGHRPCVPMRHFEAGLRTYDKVQPFQQVLLQNQFNRPAQSFKQLSKTLARIKTRRMVAETEPLLKGLTVHEQAADTTNPCGDGLAARRICKALPATMCEKAACKC